MMKELMTRERLRTTPVVACDRELEVDMFRGTGCMGSHVGANNNEQPCSCVNIQYVPETGSGPAGDRNQLPRCPGDYEIDD